MALQLSVTGAAGLDITYWKINGLQGGFDGGEIDLRFTMDGYKDSTWRSNGASAKSLTFHPIKAGGISGEAGKSSPVDRASTILQNTSGDLRPALYAWLKGHDATALTGPADDYGNSDQIFNWSSATDV